MRNVRTDLRMTGLVLKRHARTLHASAPYLPGLTLGRLPTESRPIIARPITVMHMNVSGGMETWMQIYSTT